MAGTQAISHAARIALGSQLLQLGPNLPRRLHHCFSQRRIQIKAPRLVISRKRSISLLTEAGIRIVTVPLGSTFGLSTPIAGSVGKVQQNRAEADGHGMRVRRNHRTPLARMHTMTEQA